MASFTSSINIANNNFFMFCLIAAKTLYTGLDVPME
jgi:hypothetical protein